MLSGFNQYGNFDIKEGIVLSNSGDIRLDGKIRYLPVYMAMFLGKGEIDEGIDW